MQRYELGPDRWVVAGMGKGGKGICRLLRAED